MIVFQCAFSKYLSILIDLQITAQIKRGNYISNDLIRTKKEMQIN